MNYIYKDGELYHYGVKGMKWGRRKINKWGTSKAAKSAHDKHADINSKSTKSKAKTVVKAGAAAAAGYLTGLAAEDIVFGLTKSRGMAYASRLIHGTFAALTYYDFIDGLDKKN